MDNLKGEDWSSHRPAPRPIAAPEGPDGATAVSGVVRDLDGSPLARVTVTSGRARAQTDRLGRFLLTGVGTGGLTLTVDGASANSHDRRYGLFRVPAEAAAGRTTPLGHTVWLPRLDLRHTVTVDVPTTSETVLTTPDIPGLEVRIPPGSVIRDHRGNVVRELGITPLPIDRLPFPMPHGQTVPVYFTVQPGGATIFPTGARVIYPNYTRLGPGTTVDFISYETDGRGWHTYGKGAVSSDGQSIVPGPGTTVWNLEGFSIGIGGLPLPGLGWLQDFIDWLSGDPVELSTGKLTDSHTDLAVDDLMPMTLTRHYWQGDGADRQFGLNQRLGYDWYLNQTVHHQEVDLYLPSGGKVHFTKNAEQSTSSRLVMDAVNPPPAFRGATLITSTEPFSFDLTLPDGTVWNFPWQSRVKWIKDRNGNQIRFTRAARHQRRDHPDHLARRPVDRVRVRRVQPRHAGPGTTSAAR